MFKITETGPLVNGKKVVFRINLPSITENKGFSVKVYVIDKAGQFDETVKANTYALKQKVLDQTDLLWGDVEKCSWSTEEIEFEKGTYLYRFEITGPEKNSGTNNRSLFFGDPMARETDAGIFSVFHIGIEVPFAWEDNTFKLPKHDDLIIYEINVAEFSHSFKDIADRIPYLKSLGINAIELLPINSVEEYSNWGYMPIFYIAPEERYGGPLGLKHLVNECHKNGIAVILDVVYAHTGRMFSYQIAYDRFFNLWYDDRYSDSNGQHFSPNPMVSAYSNFGRKNDWRMKSVQEFFKAINEFWLNEYHVDGFRYDHVNGFLDKKPIEKNETLDWYSHENRPTFKSLQILTKDTYKKSITLNRFQNQDSTSCIIQIAEDLGESAYQLSTVSDSAITGCWEDRLAHLSKDMSIYNFLSSDYGKELLLADNRFNKAGYIGTKEVDGKTIPASVIQFIESHDKCRLFYYMQTGKECTDDGFNYRSGLDGQPWYKLQPYGIALMTCVGIPMLWEGQEFAENTGLAADGQVRVRGLRPIHWDYFYKEESNPGSISNVLPLVSLYRILGKLRHTYKALRGPRNNAKEEYCNTDDKTLVYRRWYDNEIVIIALNFSDNEITVPVPFGHTGKWKDVLHESYSGNAGNPWVMNITDKEAKFGVSVPGNFGRILLLQ